MSPVRNFLKAAVPILALAALFLILPVDPAQASLYEIDLRGYNGSNLVCGGSLDFQSASIPVVGTATDGAADVVGSSSGVYDAIAGMGYVGMKHNVRHRVNPGFNRIFGSCSTVRTVIDDLQVEGPPGQITASLNADLLADIVADTLTSRSRLRVTVSLRLPEGKAVATNTLDIDFSESREIDQVINSGEITFDSSEVLEAELKMEMWLVAGHSPGGATVVNVWDFLDQEKGFGLHFSLAEVLTLPPGYTVNSADGDVGDNMWGGTVPVEQNTWGRLKSLYR